jgi:predicted Zn-dependent protease
VLAVPRGSCDVFRMIRYAALLLTAPLAAADDAHLHFALGVLAETRGNPAKAAAQFEQARLADPTALPLVQRAVAERMAAGDRGGAVKLVRDLAAARPDDLACQLAYSDFLDAQSRGDSLAMRLSDETLDAALAKFPEHPEIVRRLFSHAQAAGDAARQTELLQALSKDDPASVLLYASLSKAMFDAKDASAREAVDQRFVDSFAAHPGDPTLARAASDHFLNTERRDQAIEILEKHVAAAPSSLDLRVRLGVLDFAAKREAEGEKALKEVLEINPQQALAHQALAKFYRLRGDAEPAREHGSELLKIRGGSPDEFAKLADEWLAADKPREARLLLERAVFDHPTDFKLATQLAIATRRDPETTALAPRLFREAEAIRPADAKPDAAFLLESADALLAQGETKAAEDRLRTAIRSLPADAKKETAAALRKLAGIWESENRNGDAARALRQRADGLDR